MSTPEFKMFSPQCLSLKHKHKHQLQVEQVPRSPLSTPVPPPPSPSPLNLPDLALGLGPTQNPGLNVRRGRPSAVSAELPAISGPELTYVSLSQSFSYGQDRDQLQDLALLQTRSPPPQRTAAGAASTRTDRREIRFSKESNPSSGTRKQASVDLIDRRVGAQFQSEQRTEARTYATRNSLGEESAALPLLSSFARPASTTPGFGVQHAIREGPLSVAALARTRSHTPTPATLYHSPYSSPNPCDQQAILSQRKRSLHHTLTTPFQAISSVSNAISSLPKYPSTSASTSASTSRAASALGERGIAGAVSHPPALQRLTTFPKQAMNVARQESADDALEHQPTGGRGRSSSTDSRAPTLGGARVRTSRALTPTATMMPLRIEDNDEEVEVESDPKCRFAAAAQKPAAANIRSREIDAGVVAMADVTTEAPNDIERVALPAQSQQQLRTRLRDTISYV